MSRRARTPPGSSTKSVLTQNASPRYATRDEITRALEADLFLDFVLDLVGEDLIGEDLRISALGI